MNVWSSVDDVGGDEAKLYIVIFICYALIRSFFRVFVLYAM